MSENQYQMYIYVGPNRPVMPAGITVIDATPASSGPDAALRAVEAAGLTASDMRTRTLFVADPSLDPAEIMVSYAAVCGFAGRFLDFTLLETVTDVRRLSMPLIEAVDAGKAEPRAEVVQFGATHPDPRAINIDHTAELTPEILSTVRSARHAVVHVDGLNGTQALELFVITSALRARHTGDRYPLLLAGDEQLDLDNAETAVGVNLDTLRRAAADLRRARRTDDRAALVDKLEPSARSQRLLDAAATPIEMALLRLGSHQDTETGFWRCSRPERHRNGDANPSSRLFENAVRCFRCDTEPVDPLRLVMDTRNATPDEAAEWILAG